MRLFSKPPKAIWLHVGQLAIDVVTYILLDSSVKAEEKLREGVKMFDDALDSASWGGLSFVRGAPVHGKEHNENKSSIGG